MGTTERKERDFGAPRFTKEVRFSFRCRPMFGRKYGEWLGDRAAQDDISDALARSFSGRFVRFDWAACDSTLLLLLHPTS